MRLVRRAARLFHAREREALVPRLAFIKQGNPLEFEVSLEEDADWAVFRRMPGRGRA